MDIEIAVDMMELASHVDHIVLFSGDGDFRVLIEAVQRRGPRVSVVSSIKTQPPMIADELRRQADTFIDLADLSALIGRPPRPDGFESPRTNFRPGRSVEGEEFSDEFDDELEGMEDELEGETEA
jgi:uncharacterized LabA/DUF88 family protein